LVSVFSCHFYILVLGTWFVGLCKKLSLSILLEFHSVHASSQFFTENFPVNAKTIIKTHENNQASNNKHHISWTHPGVRCLYSCCYATTTLTTDRLHYKLQTRPLVREGAPRRRANQFSGKRKERVKSGHGPQRGVRHEGILTDWPSVVK
jgi:hypothetical protein